MDYKQAIKELATIVIPLTILAGLLIVDAYAGINRKSHIEENYSKLPEIIREYDENKDGVIDYKEASKLEKELLQNK